MRQTQLRAFHHVALHGGFSRAAEALGLTQPAISEQVKRLERDYDVLLIRRDRKELRLSEAGQRLYALTRQLFELEELIEEELSESRRALEGRLRIVADSACHVAPLLRRFRATYPKVQVSLIAGNTEKVISDLRGYRADIGVADSLDAGRDLEVIGLGETPILAFAARTYFPRGTKSLSLKDVAGDRLVMREAGSTTRQKVEMAARDLGLKLTPSVEAEGREAVRELVAAGLGVGFVSRAELGEDRRVIGYPLTGAGLTMKENLLVLSQRRDVRMIRAFVELATASLGGYSSQGV